MKKIIFSSAFLMIAVLATAQEAFRATHEGWLVRIEEAYALSKKTGKPILANFTGSDWCGWCKKLSTAVFDKPAFKSWAEDSVVLLELDFPRRKKVPDDIRAQNQSLQQAFKVRGYPTVWVFDLNKDEETGNMMIEALGQTGYQATLEEFTSGVDQMLKRAGNGS